MSPIVQRSYSINAGLAARVTRTLDHFKNKTLLADENGSLSGHEIRQELHQIARLISPYSAASTRVGIVMDNSVAKMLCILGCIRSGRVPVIFSAQENLEVLSRANEIACLLTDTYIENAFKLPYPVLQLNSNARKIVEYNSHPKPVSLAPKGSSLVLYTSGSSGEPKGVLIPEEGILYTVDYLIDYFALNSKSRATIFLPTSHSMGLNTQFFPTFFAGGESYLVNTAKNLSRIYRTMLETEGNFQALIGDMLRIAFEEKLRKNLPAAENVRHLQLAGGIIHREHLRMAAELFPNAIIHKGYGMTEALRVSMISSLDANFEKDTAGYVLPGQKVEIRNSEGEALPSGSIGQIHLQGPNITLGYEKQDIHEILTEDGFLPSGDMGVLDKEGRLTILGRSDSLFKINGERISAKEIEQVALESEFCIRDVKCLPFECPKIGRAKAVLFLEIPCEKEAHFFKSGKEVFEENFRKRMLNKRYTPREIMILNSFPRTQNGKLKNQVLRQIYDLADKTEKIATQKGLLFRRFSSLELSEASAFN
ncbi:MAG: acyl--CoA ligase [Proteobacteria bacterium]|nr:acyl--CoA ligase [Pseudomonadota bacterium]